MGLYDYPTTRRSDSILYLELGSPVFICLELGIQKFRASGARLDLMSTATRHLPRIPPEWLQSNSSEVSIYEVTQAAERVLGHLITAPPFAVDIR